MLVSTRERELQELLGRRVLESLVACTKMMFKLSEPGPEVRQELRSSSQNLRSMSSADRVDLS